MAKRKKPKKGNINREEAEDFVTKLVCRIPPRRWVFIPTRPCDAPAFNSICTVADQPYGRIEFIMQQATVFAICKDLTGASHNEIAEHIVDALVQGHNKKCKTDWIVLKTIGLDNKETDVLFFIRGKPRASDLTPCIIAPASINAHAQPKTPLPKLNLSARTVAKLMDYWIH
jgi:hypothetical protein